LTKKYRLVGEKYLEFDVKDKALFYFEEALQFNEKIGVKRIYNKLLK
jgi:hypothetical protein